VAWEGIVAKLADLRKQQSLVDVFDDAATRYADRQVFVAERGDGDVTWSFVDLDRRSKLAAYRLTAAGLSRGDRVLTWAPNTPELAATYLGAWRAGIIPVPLDLRFSADVVARIAERADTRVLAHGEGVLPADAGASGGPLAGLTAMPMDGLVADTEADMPSDWMTRVAEMPRPTRNDLYAIMYTSGTTGQPRGVMLAHKNVLEPFHTLISSPSMRVLIKLMMPKDPTSVSVMPMSHIFGLSELIAAPMFGSCMVFPLGRSPRALLDALRRHRPTSLAVAPRFVELLWTQLQRELAAAGRLESFERRRARAERYPYWVRRRMFRSELALLGGRLGAFNSGAAFLSPDVQAAWESIGLPVLQGYGATECGAVAGTNYFRHPRGKVGRKAKTANVELAPDGEILVSGPSVTAGYWRDPEATRSAWDEQGRYHTGDVGHFDKKGDLVLLGRKKNIIVLGNGLNVYPEDIEQQLHVAGLGETVVLETAPGRIEAVILDPERELATTGVGPKATQEERRAALYARIAAAVADANSRLTIHERIDSWRIWPEADFPRTHTLKIRRDPVREWASTAGSLPLPVRDGVGAEA
jgi:long-chain acyl-CoA synthetase